MFVDVTTTPLFHQVNIFLTPFRMRTHAPSGNVSVSFVRSISSDLGIKWDDLTSFEYFFVDEREKERGRFSCFSDRPTTNVPSIIILIIAAFY